MPNEEIAAQAEARRKKVLAHLKLAGAKSIRQLSEELNVKEGTVRNDVYTLASRKLVRENGSYPALWEFVRDR